jgi:hypothetical protein
MLKAVPLTIVRTPVSRASRHLNPREARAGIRSAPALLVR